MDIMQLMFYKYELIMKLDDDAKYPKPLTRYVDSRQEIYDMFNLITSEKGENIFYDYSKETKTKMRNHSVPMCKASCAMKIGTER